MLIYRHFAKLRKCCFKAVVKLSAVTKVVLDIIFNISNFWGGILISEWVTRQDNDQTWVELKRQMSENLRKNVKTRSHQSEELKQEPARRAMKHPTLFLILQPTSHWTTSLSFFFFSFKKIVKKRRLWRVRKKKRKGNVCVIFGWANTDASLGTYFPLGYYPL